MADTYQYKPLDPTTCSTRIVRLDGSIIYDAPMYCELGQVTLRMNIHDPDSERTAYDAISYTWEGETPSTYHLLYIRKRGRLSILPITANAYQALRRMRLRNEYRNLWIESVCIIDQQNLEEKSLQVKRMGYIYTCANVTLVWLGDVVSPSGRSTLKYLKRIVAPTAPSSAVIQDIFRSTREESKPLHDLTSFGSVKTWSLTEEFFSHPWFTRVWTLQEVALHCFDPEFHYGDETITLSVITEAMFAMIRRGFDHATVIQEALQSHLILLSRVQDWRSSWRRDDT